MRISAILSKIRLKETKYLKLGLRYTEKLLMYILTETQSTQLLPFNRMI